jgi:hypothetical protein
MTKQAVALKEITQIPADIEEMWGAPPLLSSEDPEIYRKYLLRVARAVRPADIIEWLWLKDIVDYSWEVRRLRRIKCQLIERRHDQLRREVIAEHVRAGDPVPNKIAIGESTTVRFFVEELDNYERIDALLAAAEGRSIGLLREIERRRDGLAARLRKASEDIIDGDFTDPPPDVEAGDAQGGEDQQVEPEYTDPPLTPEQRTPEAADHGLDVGGEDQQVEPEYTDPPLTPEQRTPEAADHGLDVGGEQVEPEYTDPPLTPEQQARRFILKYSNHDDLAPLRTLAMRRLE